ncbi:MAG: tyrosine-type recombinase/integrase [Candidatus Aenigmarchaeota archaeon]|nr:tyrosine-type recombinase/integrase [Candidatus Aenigmarchaeota archaeon]
MARKLPRFLSFAEVSAMFDESKVSVRDNMLLKCMFYLGMRNSEVTDLLAGDIDIINGNVKIVQGKGAKDRYIPIPTVQFKQELKDFISNKGPDEKAFYISGRQLRNIVKRYAETAKIRRFEEVHPHTLRHSYATLLQNRDTPLNIIQNLLGHARIETTTIYVHMGIEKMKEHVTKAFENNIVS